MIHAGVLSKMADFFTGGSDDEADDAFEREDRKASIVSFQDAKSTRRVGVAIFHPRRFEDVSEMVDNLRARTLVMINMIGADRVLSQRIVDFLSGAVYSLDGKMQRVAEGIYLFAPSNVSITGKEAESAVGAAYETY
ncbi:MAG: cell division protein SepF [Candidatus Eremiobacteraeota bacterium]|nr:cell division protein SepF [Candidatus Eremiobacteraeota bacterium]MBC5826774.1 cell division protein SepF [Candidatus Eremiobacteraeota bacterium]